MTNPTDHFILVEDASRVIDKRTGASWDTRDVMKSLFAPEPRGERLAMDSRLSRRPNRHPMLLARDQSMPEPAGMQYNQDQDPDDPNGGGNMLDANACLLLVTKCIQGLDGEERDKFVEGLSNLLQSDAMDGNLEILHRSNGNGNGGRANMPPYGNGGNGSNGNGLRSNNQGAIDRTRRNGARDNRRPGAMDANIRALNTSNFLKRFPYANVSLSGNGR
jgi:hypothetical protein